ncbi:MAG: MFS transporter [Anaerolineae bacterium]|nr:MFS transporter [Anaerolineae bacterium]
MNHSLTSERPRSAWWILAVVSLPVFIGALDLTIISAVLPEVIVSLKLPVKEYLDQASWAVNGYLLAYAISMTFAGRLSDLIGRRAVYVGCLLIFIVGSYLVTAYDSTFLNSSIARFYNEVLNQRPPRLEVRYLYLVIAGRIVQAFGAGAMVPITFALVGDLFPAARRGKPLGVIGAVDTVGWVLGHLYGGVMVRLFGDHGHVLVDAAADIGLTIAKPSWETLFLLNIPISLVALAGAWWVLRDVKPSSAGGRFDFLGTLFIVLALIGLNLGLGTTSPETATSATSFDELQGTASDYGPYFLIGGGIAFLLFILIESRVKHPLIPLKLFQHRNLSAASVTNLLVGFCIAIGLVSAPLLVNFRAENPTSDKIQAAAYTAGLLLSGLTIPMALAAIPGGWLSERYGYRLPTAGGLLLATVGFASTGLVWEHDTSYWLMGAQMALIGVGLGLTISPISTAVINDADEHDRGVASALILILRLVGMTIAISSLTVYSLERFDVVVAGYEAPDTDDVSEIIEFSQDANLRAAVEVIDEMQFIGAGVSAVALVLALLLRGGQRSALEHPPAPNRRREHRDIVLTEADG